MYSKHPKLLQSIAKSNLILFRKSRADRGRKRGRYFKLRLGKPNKSIARKAVEAAAIPVVAELLVAGTPMLLGKLQNRNAQVGKADYIPTDNQSKKQLGLQYISQGSGLGTSPARASIGERLSTIGKRIERGRNTYADVSRLPISHVDRLKAGLGITSQVGQDIFRDLNKPVTLGRKRR